MDYNYLSYISINTIHLIKISYQYLAIIHEKQKID
jgi:hypothetical protein